MICFLYLRCLLLFVVDVAVDVAVVVVVVVGVVGGGVVISRLPQKPNRWHSP